MKPKNKQAADLSATTNALDNPDNQAWGPSCCESLTARAALTFSLLSVPAPTVGLKAADIGPTGLCSVLGVPVVLTARPYVRVAATEASGGRSDDLS